VAVVGYDAGEHVGPAGRTLWIGLRPQIGAEVKLFFQRNEIRMPRSEDSPITGERDLVEDEVRHPASHRLPGGQEAAPDAIGDLTQPKIDTRRLDVCRWNRAVRAANHPLLCGGLEVLVGQYAAGI